MAGSRPALQMAKIKAKSAAHGGRLVSGRRRQDQGNTFPAAPARPLDQVQQVAWRRCGSSSLPPSAASSAMSAAGRCAGSSARRPRSRAEALDCLVYNFAARSGLHHPARPARGGPAPAGPAKPAADRVPVAVHGRSALKPSRRWSQASLSVDKSLRQATTLTNLDQ